ncbi:MAG: hypothetical protein KJ042_00985, partial [Deltaproteobacteria bacterium]|nr:hypothetical protein [Deltaproteobacteria bacterium]
FSTIRDSRGQRSPSSAFATPTRPRIARGAARGCRRKPSGNMRRAPERDGIARPASKPSRGTRRSRIARATWAASARTRGGSSTCSATRGSGPRITTTPRISRRPRRTIRVDRNPARRGCCAAEAGSTDRPTRASRRATAHHRTTRRTCAERAARGTRTNRRARNGNSSPHAGSANGRC